MQVSRCIKVMPSYNLQIHSMPGMLALVKMDERCWVRFWVNHLEAIKCIIEYYFHHPICLFFFFHCPRKMWILLPSRKSIKSAANDKTTQKLATIGIIIMTGNKHIDLDFLIDLYQSVFHTNWFKAIMHRLCFPAAQFWPHGRWNGNG